MRAYLGLGVGRKNSRTDVIHPHDGSGMAPSGTETVISGTILLPPFFSVPEGSTDPLGIMEDREDHFLCMSRGPAGEVNTPGSPAQLFGGWNESNKTLRWENLVLFGIEACVVSTN